MADIQQISEARDIAEREVARTLRREKVSRSIRYVILLFVGLLMLYPLVWMFSASFKPNHEIFTTLSLWPAHATWDGFINGWKTGTEYNFGHYMLNTFKYVIPKVLLTIISSTIVAYGFARFEIPWKKFWFATLITTMLLPSTVLLIPQYLMFREMGMLNSYLPLYLPLAFATQGFFVFMLIQFLRGVPRDMEEAAQIDGCNSIYIAKAVELDNSQAERAQRNRNTPAAPNPNGATNYLNRVLTEQKVNIAEKRYWEQLPALNQASKKYGVPNHYIMALWGMESSFGYYQGNYDVLSVLATLAFDGRRETLFSQEYINALKILQQNVIPRDRMKGSWAGAMGQSQFMPTSFLNYAVDADGDGSKDIWKNQFDVFASIANYLATVGWDKNLPWGVEVVLDEPMSLEMSGIEQNKKRSLSTWQAMGVRLKNYGDADLKRRQQLSKADLWLVRPNREVGRAFLVTNNYRTLLNWNNSNYFALSIGMFADRIEQRVNQ